MPSTGVSTSSNSSGDAFSFPTSSGTAALQHLELHCAMPAKHFQQLSQLSHLTSFSLQDPKLSTGSSRGHTLWEQQVAEAVSQLLQHLASLVLQLCGCHLAVPQLAPAQYFTAAGAAAAGVMYASTYLRSWMTNQPIRATHGTGKRCWGHWWSSHSCNTWNFSPQQTDMPQLQLQLPATQL